MVLLVGLLWVSRSFERGAGLLGASQRFALKEGETTRLGIERCWRIRRVWTFSCIRAL